MPIFDYKCAECGKTSEFLVNSSFSQAIRCPECGNQNMKKLISAPYIIKNNQSLKGSTCCGRQERCSTPSCESGNACIRG
jgi:putative FmdB family regulatory protein